MIPKEITAAAERFFEWDSEKREVVTYTSALLFAQHCMGNAAYLAQAHGLCAHLGIKEGHIENNLFEAMGKADWLMQIEAAARNVCEVNGRHHTEIAMNKLMELMK